MLRITSGIYRGRMLKTPPGDQTRPTQARLRQALLNSIQADLPGARVLDLFAGSGALGFESLSRGAERVIFVESARGAASVISQNAKVLQIEGQVSIQTQSVEVFLERSDRFGAPFDVIFADPPYEKGYEKQAITDLNAQAKEISDNLISDSIRISPKKEVIALIAYIQRMGADIGKNKTVTTNK